MFLKFYFWNIQTSSMFLNLGGACQFCLLLGTCIKLTLVSQVVKILFQVTLADFQAAPLLILLFEINMLKYELKFFWVYLIIWVAYKLAVIQKTLINTA